MASLFIRSITKNCPNILSKSNIVAYSRIKPSHDLLLSMSTFSSKQTSLPAHQEVIESKSDEDKLFTKETIDLVNNQIKKKCEGRLFAVIHVCGKQFKVTQEDIIILHGHWPPQPNDKIQFEKVLLVGSRDFTLIGRPVLPPNLVTITGTIIEKDLSHTKTHFVKRRRKQYQRINFIRSEHTTVRINEIAITGTVGSTEDGEPIRRIKQV